MRPRLLILVALATSMGLWPNDARPAPGEPGARARGNTFSIPVPNGFSVSTDERFTKSAPGGVMLVADQRAAPKLFRGSVVVTQIGPGPDFSPSDPAFCKAVSEGAAAHNLVALKAYRTVKTSLGDTCQWEVVDKEMATRGATSTVMYKRRDNSWVVTCNFDSRDSQTQAACSEVLAGWKFD